MMKMNSLLLIIIGILPTALFAQHPCTHSPAQPVIKKAAYPDAGFQLNPDSLTATENVWLENGDHLTVKNRGCEYFALTFRFETRRFRHDATDVAIWYRKSITMMNNLLPTLDAPLNLSAGIDQLQQYVR
ncbi:MAG TPA: hypothetical protein VK112_01485 [Fodinibius sp.]|nr:hypothetical protein [Fodinibius sp.]